MSIYEAALLLLGTAVMLLSLSAANYRGMIWVAVILVDLMLSTAYWVDDLPYADAFTAGCDFTVCVLVYVFGRHWFELWIMLLFQFSMLVSIVDLAAMIWAPGWIDHDTYSSMLEAVNYVALLMIGGVSGYAFSDRWDIPAFRVWHWLRPAGFPLFPQSARDKR